MSFISEHIQSAKVIVINALVTFVEAAGAYLLAANGLNRAALAGAAGTALSVVWNTVVKPYLKSQDILYNSDNSGGK